MGSTYYPLISSESVRGQDPKSIVSTTAASPIVVQVTGHGYSTGDSVEVFNAATASADGLYGIVVTDSDHFQLVGSASGVAGGAQGYVKNFTVLPNGTYPSDGDLVDATNLNTPTENVDNAKPYLYRATGAYRLFASYTVGTTDDTWAAWSSNAPGIFATGAWAAVSSGSSLFSATITPPPAAKPGDRLVIMATMTAATSGGTGLAALGLGVVLGGTTTFVVGSGQRLLVSTAYITVSLLGVHVVGTESAPITSDCSLDVSVMGFGNSGSPVNVNLVGHRRLILQHYRPN